MGVFDKICAFAKNEEKSIPLKVLIYCFHGGAVCIFPFIVLHAQLLGITVKEIAIISLITPISALLGPILTGLVADKLGRYGLVLVMNIILMIVSYDLLLAVPTVPHLTATVSCDGSNVLIPGCGSCLQNAENNSLQLMVPLISEADETREIYRNEIAKIQLTMEGKYQYASNECHFNIKNSSLQQLHTKINCNTSSGIEFTIFNSTYCTDNLAIPFSSSFYIFLLFRVFNSFVQAAGFAMLDTSILAEAKKFDLSIGKQRVMVMIGYATTPLLSGALTDYYSNKIGYQSHMPAFVVGSIILAIAAVITSIMNVRVEHNKESVVKSLVHLLKRTEVLLFLVMLLLLGSNFGFIEAYLFLFMNSLGSPALALGLTITVGCVSSIPILYFSDWIHKKISPELIYLICFTAYAGRLAGYSIITNPWWALLFETFEAINYQLMWVTSLKFFPIIAPKRMLATMTGIAIATHYAFGLGIGGFFGGYIIEWYGYRAAFRIMAVISLFAGVFSFLCHRYVIRKRLLIHDIS